MKFIAALLFLIFIATIAVPLAKKSRIPAEIFLFLGSCIIAGLPFMPSFRIDPEIVFDIFLPPILFSAAYFTSWHDFKKNIRPILLLAIGLVLLTTVFVGIAAKLIMPFLSWPEAFLLGGIVSPTDASVTVSILRKLGVPRRILVILEGESLINDASALTIYQFALLAIISKSFNPIHATEYFLYSIGGGIVIGFVVAWIALWILQRLNDTLAETTFTFVTAFSVYLIAVYLQASGVIATVVCGLTFGRIIPAYISSNTRINARASWSTLLFIINGFAFTLIGLALPTIIDAIAIYPIKDLFLDCVVITMIVIFSRLFWIYFSVYIRRFIFGKPSQFRWQSLFILGWAGVRGIVPLAAALAIPIGASTSSDLILFITYVVVATTLVLPTITLPFFLKFFSIYDPTEEEFRIKQEAFIRLKSLEESIVALDQLVTEKKVSKVAFDEYLRTLERSYTVIKTQLSNQPYSLMNDVYRSHKQLTKAAIDSERRTLIRLRQDGKMLDEIFWTLSNELDIEELRLKSPRL